MTHKVKKSRSAKSGKYVTQEFANENPDTTVTETQVIEEKRTEDVFIPNEEVK